MKPVYFMIIFFTLIITITAEPPEHQEHNEYQEDDEPLISDYNKDAYNDINQKPHDQIEQPLQFSQPFNSFQQNFVQNNPNNYDYRDEEENMPEEFCQFESIINNTRQSFQEVFSEQPGNNTGLQN